MADVLQVVVVQVAVVVVKYRSIVFVHTTIFYLGDKYANQSTRNYCMVSASKNIKQIRRFGNLIYVSKKMRYAVLYVNQEEVEATIENMSKLSFISKIDVSHKPFLKTDFENALPDEAKIYDYKMSL